MISFWHIVAVWRWQEHCLFYLWDTHSECYCFMLKKASSE